MTIKGFKPVGSSGPVGSVLYRPPTDHDTEIYIFECPGCECMHFFRVKGERPLWNWNGDLVEPTVSPSIVVTVELSRCHFFIKKGQLEFLEDCTHEFAGKTVAMTEVR